MPKTVKSKKKKVAKKAARKAEPFNPIPSGFRTLTPDLVVSNGSEAIEFYKKAFGAKELSKNPLPDGKIMNAQLKIGDSIVMLSDEFPGGLRSPKSIGGTPVRIHIYTKNVDKLWEQALSAGATVTMPLDNQFWGDRYGQISDPFGHYWSLSQRVRMRKEEMAEKQRVAMATFAQAEQPQASNPESAVSDTTPSS